MTDNELLLKNIKDNLANEETLLITETPNLFYFIPLSNNCEKYFSYSENKEEISLVRAYRFEGVNIGLDELIIKQGNNDIKNIVSAKHHEKNPFTIITQKTPFFIMSYRQRVLNVLEGGKYLKKFAANEIDFKIYKKYVSKFVLESALGLIKENEIEIY